MKQLSFFKLFFILFTVSNYSATSQALKPGDVSPHAKYIEADRLDPFNLGAALISQGLVNRSTALIDKNGDFIVPYRKYLISGELNEDFDKSKNASSKSGYFGVKDLSRYDNIITTLTSTAKVIESQSGSLVPGTRLLWGIHNSKQIANVVIYDPITKVQTDLGPFPMAPDFRYYSCGLAPFQLKEYEKYGFKNINGKIIIPAQYEEVYKFSDGFAIVGARDQNGELKYGYVDSTGKLAIPLQYSRKPGDFYGGTAIVYPKLGADFVWALINKKGEIIQKYSYNAGFSPYNEMHYREMHYDPSDGVFLLSDGKTIKESEFLAKLRITPNSKFERDVIIDIDCGDGKIYYKRILSSQLPPPIIAGYVDIYAGKKMEGPFQEGFYFDKVSGLAYARCIIGKNKMGIDIIREGYINEDGIFVIVKKEQSDF